MPSRSQKATTGKGGARRRGRVHVAEEQVSPVRRTARLRAGACRLPRPPCTGRKRSRRSGLNRGISAAGFLVRGLGRPRMPSDVVS